MAALVVADASVLIALDQIGQIPLLRALFEEVVIPPEVRREVAPGMPQLPEWIKTRSLLRPLHARVLAASLDAGESEAISLALEGQAEWAILDDLPARRLAKELGIAIVGTAGVLFAAKQHGLIPSIRGPLDELRARGFRLRQNVYAEILNAAGEGEVGAS